jgi:peptide/nickel transport system substrate-binding protein
MRRSTAALVAGAALAGFVAMPFTVAAAQSATPVKGGTVIVQLGSTPNTPWYLPLQTLASGGGEAGTYLDLMYQPLIWTNQNNQFEPSESIASKITSNKDGTVYNVYMNPKWHWSNGKPVTSADAQFTWDVLIATERSQVAPWPSLNYGFGGLPQDFKSFKVDGPYEFTITLNTPQNQQAFIYVALERILIMPAVWNKYPTNITKEIAYLGKEGTNLAFDNPVSGPFELKSESSNETFTLVPNPSYSGQKAHIARLILQVYTSDASEFAALKTGQLQFGLLPAEDWSARSQLAATSLPEPYGYDLSPIFLNQNPGAEGGVNTIFDQLYVRQALEEGIDETEIGEKIGNGLYEPDYGPIPDHPAPLFDPVLAKPIYPFSPAKGKALLEAHGWHEVDGVMTKGSQELKFTLLYPSSSEQLEEEMEFVQADWAEEGIQVTLRPLASSAVVGDLTSKKYEMIQITYGPGPYSIPSRLFYKDTGLDDEGFDNPTENALIEKALEPYPTEAQSQAAYFAYELYTAKEVPLIWLPLLGGDYEVATSLHGVTAATANGTDIEPQYWWLSGG